MPMELIDYESSRFHLKIIKDYISIFNKMRSSSTA